MSEPEVAAQEARSIVFYMAKARTQTERDLLMTDYTARREALEPKERAHLDELAFARHKAATQGEEVVPVPAPRSSPQPSTADLPRVDVAILTILPVELKAVRRVFQLVDPRRPDADPDGTRYYYGSVASHRLERDLSIMATLAEGAHDLNANEAVAKILRRCNPGILCLVGIGGGNKDEFDFGDVIVPRTVVNQDAARAETDGDKPRPRPEPLSWHVGINLNYYDYRETGLVDEVRAYCETLGGQLLPPKFKIRDFSPKVKSQNTVVGVTARLLADGRTLGEWRDRDQLIVAVDQESYGFAKAARGRWWAVFRGVSDFGDPDKDSNYHFLAASTAALTLKNFLEKEYLPPEEWR